MKRSNRGANARLLVYRALLNHSIFVTAMNYNVPIKVMRTSFYQEHSRLSLRGHTPVTYYLDSSAFICHGTKTGRS